ncbi:MAG: glycosyltransferase [Saprospiraceae bacterium]
MLKAKQIVCVGFPKWEGDYMKSTVLLMAELAKNNSVLYVDYPFTWKDVIKGLNATAGIPSRRLLGLQPRLRSLSFSDQAQLHLLSLPPFIPANWTASNATYDRLLAYNGKRAAASIKVAMKQLNFTQPIVINAFNPALGNVLAGELGEQLLVYYCYDEISAANWVGKHGHRHEIAFLEKVDLTIVSSAQLLQDKSPLTRNCQLVNNGVSLDLFQGVDRCPPDDKGLRVGYLGSVDERLDYELLTEVMRQLPDYQFQFVGRIVDKAGAAQLAKQPNCQLLGSQPPSTLAKFVAGFQVGLIPFKCNRLTAGIYPLKINEYLAMGIPVVATRFTDLSSFEPYAHLAEAQSDFKDTIQMAIASDTPAKVQARQQFAATNSWEKRGAEFGQAIYQSLEEKLPQLSF